MTQRHKHADVIIAWAEGSEIEYRKSPEYIWGAAEFPGWYENYEYRVKPPKYKYRVALFLGYVDDGEIYAAIANTQKSVDIYEKSPRFIRWLTDWVEYEE